MRLKIGNRVFTNEELNDYPFKPLNKLTLEQLDKLAPWHEEVRIRAAIKRQQG